MRKTPLSAREIDLISSLIESASQVQLVAAICLREGRWVPREPGVPILDSLADRIGMFTVVADALQREGVISQQATTGGVDLQRRHLDFLARRRVELGT
jgi:hypothetical protein